MALLKSFGINPWITFLLQEFKKLVKEELGLALSYIRSPKRGNPWLHLTFGTAEEQQKAMKVLHKYAWRKKTLTCSVSIAILLGLVTPSLIFWACAVLAFYAITVIFPFTSRLSGSCCPHVEATSVILSSCIPSICYLSFNLSFCSN